MSELISEYNRTVVKNWLEPYIEQRSEEIKDLLCKDNRQFYVKHTELFEKMKESFPDLSLRELLEIEELFNEHISFAAEAYKTGFREGYDHNK
ncbi:hypothetical protein PMSD_18285 [Paenibacillus macquariensis subsp. defensor]|nr:hypothetical protein PMSD_18285 [Paenibacillus macquariensis subsp. defensor]